MAGRQRSTQRRSRAAARSLSALSLGCGTDLTNGSPAGPQRSTQLNEHLAATQPPLSTCCACAGLKVMIDIDTANANATPKEAAARDRWCVLAQPKVNTTLSPRAGPIWRSVHAPLLTALCARF